MKILFCGDTPTVHTGFGVVSKNILTRLSKMGHEIVVLGINHYGEPYDQGMFPFPIYPVRPGGPENLYGYDILWKLYSNVKPDVLFFLNDPWIINEYISRQPENGLYPHTKVIGYYPTDAGPIKKEWMETLNGLDAQICYSNFAERVATESNGGKRPANLYQVYHGVDTSKFFPINQQLARAQLKLPKDAFIIGMVARNQYRKRFDIVMSAFSKFIKDKPKALLYLHTSMVDIGFDVLELVNQLHLEKRIITTKDVTPSKGVTDEELNVIYNSFDVNCLISLGDGFGLPVAESMATGCPQLVSDHSCLKELVDGHGGLTVKTVAWLLNTSGINTWGGISDVEDLKEKMEILYNNNDLRIKLAEQGYKFITQEQFTWDHAVNEFNTIFKRLFHLI